MGVNVLATQSFEGLRHYFGENNLDKLQSVRFSLFMEVSHLPY